MTMRVIWFLIINLILISCVVGINGERAKAQPPYQEVVLRKLSRDSPYYPLRNIDYDHSSLAINSAEHVAYFDTYLAIKADRSVRIQLTNNANDSNSNVIFNIDLGRIIYTEDQHTSLSQYSPEDGYKNINRIATPCILTSSKFREFYLRIDNGKLEFGVEGSTPLLSHQNPKLELVNFFQFRYGWEHKARIRYDCPRVC